MESSGSKQVADLLDEVDRLREEVEGLNAALDIHYRCLERARQMWQAAHPEADYWPDGAKAWSWVMDRLAKLERMAEAA